MLKGTLSIIVILVANILLFYTLILVEDIFKSWNSLGIFTFITLLIFLVNGTLVGAFKKILFSQPSRKVGKVYFAFPLGIIIFYFLVELAKYYFIPGNLNLFSIILLLLKTFLVYFSIVTLFWGCWLLFLEKIKSRSIIVGIILSLIVIISPLVFSLSQSGSCGKPVAGYVRINCKEDISVIEAIAFVQDNLIGEYGFDESSFTNPNLGDSTYRWLKEHDSDFLPYRTLTLYSEEERMRTYTESFSRELRDIMGSLKSDDDLENLYYTQEYHFTNYRIFPINFHSGEMPLNFLSSYPQLIPLPDGIRVSNNPFLEKRADRVTNQTKLFIHNSISELLNSYLSFRMAMERKYRDIPSRVVYDDYSYSFEIIMPPTLSRKDTENIIKESAMPSDIKFKLPNEIGITVKVSVGKEKSWIKQFEKYNIVESADRPTLICVNFDV